MNIHEKHWTKGDKEALTRARTFGDLANIALNILKRHPKGFHIVSGPISTGGVGTRGGNQKVFAAVIERLSEREGLPVFSQIPFEDKILEIKNKWIAEHPEGGYCMPILDDFYEPVFSSGRVSTLHFIHGYESSQGAVWEHENCEKWGIKKRYLSPEMSADLYAEILKQE